MPGRDEVWMKAREQEKAAGFDERKCGAHQMMVRLVGQNKRVLEVGCGKGFVSERLKQQGCIVTGIELNEEHAKRAERFCERLVVGNVESMKLDFKPNSFDVLLFGDVLEHLHNPEKVLRKLKASLNDNGLIVASIPNIGNWKIRLGLLLGKFDYQDWGILDRTHLHFFTGKTARQLLEKAGYRIVKKEFVPSFPLPFLKSELARLNPNMFAFQFVFAARKK